MEFNEKHFILGFNSGYILANHEPIVLSSVIKELQSDNSYIKGLLQGQIEFENEQSKFRLDELRQSRGKSIDTKEKDL
ncbi:MAG TPA: hypothetical protein PLJ00_07985 [Chitinophagales bacterium]|nr:hypothetical protein [Chitinophagales bacterium]HRG27816.1 hypothetical protein [Chitinophagales bacterium]HRG84516.1 hypothetical protein [Chitinophagales bacterium]HRH53289.1 hypothetical protein [Chitinophagales bacterium]